MHTGEALAKPNLFVGTPCYGGLVTHLYLHSVLKLAAYATARKFPVNVLTAANDSLVPRSRNSIVAAFLGNPAATHLLFIDADTGFEAEHVGRLLSLGEDVAAGMYPIKHLDWQAAARRSALSEGGLTIDELREAGLHYVGVPYPPTEREERDGFVTAEYAGTGFMLIRRSAIERMIAAYPETRYSNAHTYPAAARASTNQYALFDAMVDRETDTYLSEDFAFCKRWRALGGKVWLDTRSRLRHVGSYEFSGIPRVEETRVEAVSPPDAEARSTGTDGP